VAEAEAENGILSGVVVSKSSSGYSGAGYVTGFDSDGDKVTVTVTIQERGLYKIKIRFNGPYGAKTQDFSVNGGFTSQVSFPATSVFSEADAGSYVLEKGDNTLSVIKNWGWIEIDKFTIYSTSKNSYNIATSLVDTNANEATQSLYQFLYSQFGKKIISGQTNDYYANIKTITGKSPVLRVGDLQHFTQGYAYLWQNGGHTFGWHDDGSVTSLINWYNSTEKKGILSFQWHWHSPTGGQPGTNTFYTNQTTFDVTKAVQPGTAEYGYIIRDIDSIATQLKKLQDANIPVLWRPLHEAGGGWFWWGAKGAVPCKALYNIIFDRLKNYHQLHNLIWVWSTPETDWYPGNDKVDIIGYDSYPGAYNYGTQKNIFDILFKLTKGEKLIAMSENGPIPDPGECLTLDAPWSYFMSWSNLATLQNSTAHLIEVFSNPNVLTLENIGTKSPEIKTGETGFLIFPNPAGKVINIRGGSFDRLEITGINGQLVFQTSEQVDKIDIQKFARGFYIIRILKGTEMVSKKLAISN